MATKTTEMSRKIVEGFLSYLDKNHQLDLLPEIVELLEKKVSRKVDYTQALVLSAIKMDSDALREVQSLLQHSLGHEVTIINRVDPDVIGGMKIRIGDKVIDLSLQHKINQLKEALE